MIEVLLTVIVCQLGFIIHKMNKPQKKEKTAMDYSKVMPQYIGKECELILKRHSMPLISCTPSLVRSLTAMKHGSSLR